MKILLVDITKAEADAIVNAASPDLTPQPGICASIFGAADSQRLSAYCRQLGGCRIGHAVVTPSFGLPARYIIHVAGAGWYGGLRRERLLMEQCYLSALRKGLMIGCRSIALPLIFSGDCHMPRAESIRIAGQAIAGFGELHPELQLSLVLYRRGIYEMAQRILNPVP